MINSNNGYMPTNPMQYDQTINQLIKDLNSSLPANQKQEKLQTLADKINKFRSPDALQSVANQLPKNLKEQLTQWDSGKYVQNAPEFIDNAVKQLRDPNVQKILRINLGLLKEGDIVCEKSQGNFISDDPRKGENACACICLVASRTFLNKSLPKTENEMYNVMGQGIKYYEDKKLEGKVFFEELLESSDISPDAKIVIPVEYAHMRGIDQEFLDEMNKTPTLYPLEGEVRDFTPILKVLDQTASKVDQKACGVITSNGETIVVGFTSPGKPVLFDSHGTKYKGVDKGASLRHFDSIVDMQDYMKSKFKSGGAFTMVILQNDSASKAPITTSASKPVSTILMNLGLSVFKSFNAMERDEESFVRHMKNLSKTLTDDQISMIYKRLQAERKDSNEWYKD